MPSPRHAAWLTPALISLACVLLAVLLQGQDANWDLRNYHLYTPMAVMDGRLAQDVAAAQLQTWHNPALDFPLAWMARAGAPGWLVTAWLALPAFVALLFGLRLLDLLWPAQQGVLRSVVAALVATAGAAVLPTIGSSMNDAFVAAGVLPALWWALASQGRRGPWATWLPVGLAAGAAAGLKLTAVIYCVGFVAAALVAGPRREVPARVLALAVGGVLAVSVTAGPWAWHLWQAHGNPLFPYFNDWFQSPDALPLPYKDERFLPSDWYDTLMVPVHLLFESRRYSESRLADPRLLFGLLALAVSLARNLRSPAGTATNGGPVPSPWLLPVFVLASYATWLQLYGIYRYLYALELLLSIAIVGVLSELVPRRPWREVALVGCLLLLVAATNHPYWGRQPFRSPMVSVAFPPIAGDSLVLLAEDTPLGHAVAFLPASVPALSLHNNFMDPDRCTRLQARVERRIREHRGPIHLLREMQDPPTTEGRFQAYGLSLLEECLPIDDSLARLELCPLSRTSVTAVRCPWPPPGR